MHLCAEHQSIDWDDRIRKEQALTGGGGPLKAYCPYCTHIGGTRVRLPHSSHAMCDVCAKKRSECQACGASTLSTVEQASEEAFETLFDAFVTLVKTYGATPAREVLSEAPLSKEEAVHVGALVVLDVGLVDSAEAHQKYHYRLKRPIWTKVWGQLSYATRPPRCGNCAPPPRNQPSMTRAAHCGHWTAGHQAAWCLVCAVEHRQCSVCETSTE